MNFSDLIVTIDDRNRQQLATVGITEVRKAMSVDLASEVWDLSQKMTFAQSENPTSTGVCQHCSYATGNPPPLFTEIATATARQLRSAFPKELPDGLAFNDFLCLRYPVSLTDHKFAISPHFDQSHFVGLIAIYVITGRAPFGVCGDRSGSNQFLLNPIPTSLILMRGPGYLGYTGDKATIRPLHFVGRVSSERLTLGLRQKRTKAPVPKETASTYTQA